jgi:hypothetical protein
MKTFLSELKNNIDYLTIALIIALPVLFLSFFMFIMIWAIIFDSTKLINYFSFSHSILLYFWFSYILYFFNNF